MVSFGLERRMKSRTQWLLLQDQEDGIDQFEVLGEVVKLQYVSNCSDCTPFRRHT